MSPGPRKVLPEFEQLVHAYYRFKINELLEEINLQGGSVLELGCGSGMNSVNLMKDHSLKRATLVDFSKKALEIAAQNARDYNVSLVHSDIFDLDLEQRFDLVFSVGLIEHFMGKRRSKA